MGVAAKQLLRCLLWVTARLFLPPQHSHTRGADRRETTDIEEQAAVQHADSLEAFVQLEGQLSGFVEVSAISRDARRALRRTPVGAPAVMKLRLLRLPGTTFRQSFPPLLIYTRDATE